MEAVTNSSKKQIKLGSLISYFTIFLNIILGLIYTPWILKTVGKSDYGLYTLASSFVALFLLDFGMSAAVSRFISNFRAQGKQDSINSFVGLALKFYILICSIILVILFVLYFFIPNIYTGLTEAELESFKIVFIITASFVVVCFPVNIFNGILNAYEQYIWLKGADIIHKIVAVIVTIISLIIYPNVYVLVFINGFFNLVTMIVKIILVKVKTPVKVSFKKDSEVTFKNVFSFSLWATANTLSQQMTINIMPTILGMVANTFAITVYGFARTIEGYVYNISQGINGLFMPSVSRVIVNDKDAHAVLPLMKRVGRINLTIMAILFIGLISLGQEFVHLWVGDEYKILYECFLLLTIYYLIAAPEQIASTSVTVLNKLQYTSIINFVCSVIALVVAYFLAQSMGVLGICLVIFVANLLKVIGYNVVYYKVIKINIFSFFKDCHLKMLPAIGISGVISYFLCKYLPLFGEGLMGWLYFFIKVAIVCVIFFVTMWLIGWNKDEKKLILSFIPFLKNKETK